MRGHCPGRDPLPSTTLVVTEKQHSSHPKDVSSSSPHTSQLTETANAMIISASFLGLQRPRTKSLEWTSRAASLFYFVSLWSDMPCHLFCIFFFWDTAMPIHLHYVCSCFFTKRAEWSSPNRERVAHKTKNSHYLALTEKVCRLLFIITLEYILTMWGHGCVN